MRVTVFSTRKYDRQFLDAANSDAGSPHSLAYLEPKLTPDTAVLATGTEAVCAFVNDRLDRATITRLAALGTRLVVLRSAGFNNVDLSAATDLGIQIGRVPAYSPEAVAEHTVALILSLTRKLHRAYARVREGNFSLDGLLGFTLGERTVGIIGAGRIGVALAKILSGFGCHVLAADPAPTEALSQAGGKYAPISEILQNADIISLHCPLTSATRHMIDAAAVARMKHGVMLINTSRGAVIDTRAVINALKSGKIGYLGLDVYEEEEDLFFEDWSDRPIQDDLFARLLTFPNVLITGHQGFFTEEALIAIAHTTIRNLSEFEALGRPAFPVSAPPTHNY